jgi:hypothetical protein
VANELQTDYQTGRTVYAQLRNAVGQIWRTDTTVFEAYNTANIANYAITTTEQGTASGYYAGNMPTAPAGFYNVVAKDRAGGSPAETDKTVGVGSLTWDGAAVAVSPTVAQIVTGMMQDTTAGNYTIAGSFGKGLFTSGNAPGAAGGLFIAGSNAATTVASLTCTGSFTISDGLIISRSSGNSHAISATGSGSGNGFLINGGATGPGLHINGGGTSGNGIEVDTTVGDALFLNAMGGHGLHAQGGGVSHGIFTVGGFAGDGLHCTKGTGGKDISGQLASNATDLILVAGKTLPHAIQIIGGTAAGASSGIGTGVEVFQDFAGSTVATVTLDSNNDRTGVVYAV